MLSTTKRCSRCQIDLPRESFYGSPEKGWGSYCRGCAKAYSAERSRLPGPKESAKRRRTKHKYGISWDAFVHIFEQQGKSCKLCRKPMDFQMHGIANGWEIDHDHATGKVRGILCKNCNTGLGRFKDDISLMRRAIEYVQKQGDV